MGEIRYLADSTRLEVEFSIACLAVFILNSTKKIVLLLNHLLRYLKETTHHGIMYSSPQGEETVQPSKRSQIQTSPRPATVALSMYQYKDRSVRQSHGRKRNKNQYLSAPAKKNTSQRQNLSLSAMAATPAAIGRSNLSPKSHIISHRQYCDHQHRHEYGSYKAQKAFRHTVSPLFGLWCHMLVS